MNIHRIIKFITIASIIAFLNGCSTVSDKLAAENQTGDIDGYIFYASEEPEKEKVKIPIKTKGSEESCFSIKEFLTEITEKHLWSLSYPKNLF